MVMVQNKEQLLSQKHTGFEDSSSYYNLLSLPLSADFFFAESVPSPDSETNESSLFEDILTLGRFVTGLFYSLNPFKNE